MTLLFAQSTRRLVFRESQGSSSTRRWGQRVGDAPPIQSPYLGTDLSCYGTLRSLGTTVDQASVLLNKTYAIITNAVTIKAAGRSPVSLAIPILNML